MSEPLHPRPRPCASCPYRRDVPAGIWHPDEYAKLPLYDRDSAEQPTGVFLCHQTGEHDPDARMCAGWVACHGPDLLALRLAVIQGRVAADALDYTTTVELFPTGADAAAHGLSGVDAPDPRAVAAAAKIAARRGLMPNG